MQTKPNISDRDFFEANLKEAIRASHIERARSVIQDFLPLMDQSEALITPFQFSQTLFYIKDPQESLRMLQTLYEYLPENKSDYIEWAGLSAADYVNLDAFKWLEEKGLKKEISPEFGNNNHARRLFIHATSSSLLGEKYHQIPVFADYLIKNGYPINPENKQQGSPVYGAIHSGHLDVARKFLENGAIPDSSHIAAVIRYSRNNGGLISPEQALDFTKYLHEERGVPLPQEAMDHVCRFMSYTSRDILNYGPLASYLIEHGLSPTKAAEEYGLKANFQCLANDPDVRKIGKKFEAAAKAEASTSEPKKPSLLAKIKSIFQP